jgi:UDP-glucose 4-epimerase
MQEVTGAHHLTPEFHPPRKINPVPRRLADTTRAKRDLGFEAKTSLHEGLRRLAAWRREALAQSEATAEEAVVAK